MIFHFVNLSVIFTDNIFRVCLHHYCSTVQKMHTSLVTFTECKGLGNHTKTTHTWLFSRERLWNSVVHFLAKRTRDYCFANRCVKLGERDDKCAADFQEQFCQFCTVQVYSVNSSIQWVLCHSLKFLFSILSSWEWYFLSPSLWQKGLSEFAAEVPTAPSVANAPLAISHHFTAEISRHLGWWASDYLEGSIKVIDVDIIIGLLNWAVNTASSPDFLDLINFNLSVI